MLKVLCASILFLAQIYFTQSCAAQAPQRDVVYLRNGSVIHGTITDLEVNKSVRIETSDGSIFVFKWEEIERITKEPLKEEVIPRKATSRGLYAGYFALGINQIMGGANSMTLLTLHVINAIHFRRATVGLGVGFESGLGGGDIVTPAKNKGMESAGDKHWNGSALLPMWIDGRTDVTQGDNAFFLWGHVGYTFLAADGFSLGTGIGVRFGDGYNLNPFLQFGIRSQSSNGSEAAPGGSYVAFQMLLGLAF